MDEQNVVSQERELGTDDAAAVKEPSESKWHDPTSTKSRAFWPTDWVNGEQWKAGLKR